MLCLEAHGDTRIFPEIRPGRRGVAVLERRSSERDMSTADATLLLHFVACQLFSGAELLLCARQRQDLV